MVKKKSLWKNIYREIFRSSGRFLAILGIILLGSGFFIGLRSARGAMAMLSAGVIASSLRRVRLAVREAALGLFHRP